MVRGTFSPARAWRPTVVARLARTLGLAIDMYRALIALASFLSVAAFAATPTQFTLDDTTRGRRIPVEVYEPATASCSSKCQVVLFGTGYRATLPEYSFILEALAEAGYFVIGIQHDLEQDLPMPNTGDLVRDRMPFWNRGTGSVEFVATTLRLRFPELDWGRVVLAGHSQGGDIAARLASMPTFLASALVTLDNRRVPLPTSAQLPVLTIRSSDQSADPGVLPDSVTQSRAKTCIVRMASTRHDDMNNGADQSEKAKIIETVVRFLRHARCASEA